MKTYQITIKGNAGIFSGEYITKQPDFLNAIYVTKQLLMTKQNATKEKLRIVSIVEVES